jgi:hypothetical protein
MPASKHQTISQFVNSTSDFRKIDVNTLNIQYVDVDKSDDIANPVNLNGINIHKDLYVGGLSIYYMRSTEELLISDRIDNKTKTFVQLMLDVADNEVAMINTEESRTDSLVSHLFERLEFNEYPLMIRIQPLLKFMIHTKEISSKYDFAVIKHKQIMLVDEDKHLRNTGPPSAWGEYQIAGEIIAGAYSNYSSKRTYNELLYAVRVIGLKFTFYKATIPPEYLDSLGEGFPSLSVNIARYPPNDSTKDFPFLDFGNPTERAQIIDILVRIREFLRST